MTISDPTRNAALEMAIARAPDDVETYGIYAVYSDWLSERGEPHGALIALHLHRHDGRGKPTRNDLIEEARLVNAVFDDLKRLQLPVVSYTIKLGFLESLRIGGGGRRAGEVLKTILTHRGAPFLREIEVTTTPGLNARWPRPSEMDLDQKGTTSSVWRTICDVGLPATIRAATLPPPLASDVTNELRAIAHVPELRWPLRAVPILIENMATLRALRSLTLTAARLDGLTSGMLLDHVHVLSQIPTLALALRFPPVADLRESLLQELPDLRIEFF